MRDRKETRLRRGCQIELKMLADTEIQMHHILNIEIVFLGKKFYSITS